MQAGKTNRPPIVQHRAKRLRPRGVAERLYGLRPYVLCALGTLCVCAVHAPPFLSRLPPWLLWLVWLRVRPRLRDVHVVLARLAPARLARDGTLQRPPGAGLARRPDRARAAAGLSTLWAEEAAAWGRSGRSAGLRGRGSGSGPCLWPAGSWDVEAPAWAGQRPVEPGRRGYLGGERGRRGGPATLGTRASGKPMAGTRGPVEMSMAWTISERGPSSRTPVVSPEEVRSSGSHAQTLFGVGLPSLTQAGTGRRRVLVSLCQPVALLPGYLEKVGFRPSPFVGTPCEHFWFTYSRFLDGLLMYLCLYILGLKP